MVVEHGEDVGYFVGVAVLGGGEFFGVEDVEPVCMCVGG